MPSDKIFIFKDTAIWQRKKITKEDFIGLRILRSSAQSRNNSYSTKNTFYEDYYYYYHKNEGPYGYYEGWYDYFDDPYWWQEGNPYWSENGEYYSYYGYEGRGTPIQQPIQFCRKMMDCNFL